MPKNIKDHHIVRLVMKTQKYEEGNPNHPINRFKEHFNEHYFGLGKVRTINPNDQGILSHQDHDALHRMHSRLALLLDMQGDREQSQNHLAAASHHKEQQKTKKEGGLKTTQGEVSRQAVIP